MPYFGYTLSTKLKACVIAYPKLRPIPPHTLTFQDTQKMNTSAFRSKTKLPSTHISLVLFSSFSIEASTIFQKNELRHEALLLKKLKDAGLE